MAIAIGVVSWPSRACQPASNIMGFNMYNGLFDAMYPQAYLPLYQNFTVAVPSSFVVGQAQVNVAHATLIGFSNTELSIELFKRIYVR